LKLGNLYLNNEELLIGFIYGILFMPVVGLWAVPTALATSFLWAYGGAEKTSKAWRRYGVPLVVSFILTLVTHKIAWLLSAPGAIAILSIGYGIPDVNDPKGSTLGGLPGQDLNRTPGTNVHLA